ncbi:hypothetical protein BJF90_13570 [Pseudonocardia sp. CNS-004]|nr:hypothetical protein BJF90_13570 [Pseudonocardia sp. CNS-004]
MTQNGGGSMSSIQRLMVAVRSEWPDSNPDVLMASLPMLVLWTNSSWVRSIRLSSTSRWSQARVRVSPSPAHSGSSFQCMSGTRSGSAASGSPGHTQT